MPLRSSGCRGFPWAALAIGLAAPALAHWNFSLVADQFSTGINIGAEAPSISGQEIAFFGDSNSGLYKRGPTGGPVIVFQTGGPIPGAPGSNFFQIFEAYSFSGQTFATTTPSENGSYALTNTGPPRRARRSRQFPTAAEQRRHVFGDGRQ